MVSSPPYEEIGKTLAARLHISKFIRIGSEEAIKFASVACYAKNDLSNLNDCFCPPFTPDPCCELLGKAHHFGKRVRRIPVANGLACLPGCPFRSGRLGKSAHGQCEPCNSNAGIGPVKPIVQKHLDSLAESIAPNSNPC